MHPVANTKTVVSLLGTGVTNGATVTANIDTLGFKFASVQLLTGTADVVSNTPSVLKLSQSDTTDSTNFANLTPFVGGTDFTIANADTSNANIFTFNVDMRGRKRYLKLTTSPRTTQQCIMVARLSNGETAVDSATDAGATQLVEG
jgi:hypothetical protein